MNVCDAARAASPCDYASLFSPASASRRQSTPPPSWPSLADKPNPSFACRQSIPRPSSPSLADKPSLRLPSHGDMPGHGFPQHADKPSLPESAHSCRACPTCLAQAAPEPYLPTPWRLSVPSRTRPCRHTSPLLDSPSRQPNPGRDVPTCHNRRISAQPDEPSLTTWQPDPTCQSCTRAPRPDSCRLAYPGHHRPRHPTSVLADVPCHPHPARADKPTPPGPAHPDYPFPGSSLGPPTPAATCLL